MPKKKVREPHRDVGGVVVTCGVQHHPKPLLHFGSTSANRTRTPSGLAGGGGDLGGGHLQPFGGDIEPAVPLHLPRLGVRLQECRCGLPEVDRDLGTRGPPVPRGVRLKTGITFFPNKNFTEMQNWAPTENKNTGNGAGSSATLRRPDLADLSGRPNKVGV